jgi:hypothetical protein
MRLVDSGWLDFGESFVSYFSIWFLLIIAIDLRGASQFCVADGMIATSRVEGLAEDWHRMCFVLEGETDGSLHGKKRLSLERGKYSLNASAKTNCFKDFGHARSY